MFDVGADCLLMSDAGDISRARVSSVGAYSLSLVKLCKLGKYLICENIAISNRLTSSLSSNLDFLLLITPLFQRMT